MQWIALEKHNIISASKAVRKKNYLCPECHALVRLRAGFHRQRHFYHLRASSSCKQHKKTLEHLQTQVRLAELGKNHRPRIEHSFPDIGRIADIALLEARTVIEVQVSPISLEEVKARIRDYQSIGWRIVWILHDRTFNHRILSPAEQHLRFYSPCYFTNITKLGNGFFYDQFEILQNLRRRFKGMKSSILPHELSPMPNKEDLKKAPTYIRQRGENWSYFSRGDLLDRWLKNRDTFGQRLSHFERAYIRPRKILFFLRIPLQFYIRMIKKRAEGFARKG